MRRKLVGSLAAVAASAALVMGSATVASATHAIEVGDTGTLVARGAAVLVPVEVTCPVSTVPQPPFPFPGSGLSVTVNQRSGNRIAQGFGSANVACTGTEQTVQVQVTAQQAPFKNGTALVTATMTVCEDFFINCHTVSDTEEIRIRH
jgi:hypothetical protein